MAQSHMHAGQPPHHSCTAQTTLRHKMAAQLSEGDRVWPMLSQGLWVGVLDQNVGYMVRIYIPSTLAKSLMCLVIQVVKDRICLRTVEKVIDRLVDSREQAELRNETALQPLDINADGTHTFSNDHALMYMQHNSSEVQNAHLLLLMYDEQVVSVLSLYDGLRSCVINVTVMNVKLTGMVFCFFLFLTLTEIVTEDPSRSVKKPKRGNGSKCCLLLVVSWSVQCFV